MWWLTGAALGLAVVVIVTTAMALIARACPPGRARELVGFMPNCVVLLRRLRASTGLSRRARLALAAALGYVLSPVQLIPNIIPVLGQADDMLAVALALRYACRHLPLAEVQAA